MSGRISSPLELGALIDSLIDARQLQGVSDYETRILQSYGEQARSCLESFAWCTEVRDQRFGLGAANMIAVFAMEVLVKGQTREWLWVVAGELPAAYFALSRASCPCDALREYSELVERWIDAVHHGTLYRDVFPLGIEPTPAAASLVNARLQAMRRYVVPALCIPVGEAAAERRGSCCGSVITAVAPILAPVIAPVIAPVATPIVAPVAAGIAPAAAVIAPVASRDAAAAAEVASSSSDALLVSAPACAPAAASVATPVATSIAAPVATSVATSVAAPVTAP